MAKRKAGEHRIDGLVSAKWENVGSVRICADAERGTPCFHDDFREACYTGFGKAIIGLTALRVSLGNL